MKVRHLLIALFAGLVTYSLLALIDGPYSSRRLEQLIQYHSSLEENLELLAQTGEALEAHYYELRDDSRAIIREAQRIGMVLPGEQLLQQAGRQRSIEGISPGQIIMYSYPDPPDPMFRRAIALSSGLLIFMLLVIADPPEQPGRRTVSREQRGNMPEGSGQFDPRILGRVGSDVEMGQSMRVQVASRE